MARISNLTVAELSAMYASGTVSPVEAVRASLENTDRFQNLNVFVQPPDRDRIQAEARESEARWRNGSPRGLLDGIPITIKDAIIVKGFPTLAGSKANDPAQIASEDAPAVARVREEGAIILGKTTTPEFGWKGVTDSPLTGISRNPWDSSRTPGGSSGGSAAAVAAGIGHASIGTDAAGSVRIPGAFCGLVALKASRGRIPANPPSPLGTMAHIGPICRTVLDARLLLAVMSRPDPRDWNALPPDHTLANWRETVLPKARLRVAYSHSLGYASVQPEVYAVFKRALGEFATLDADLEDVEKPFDNPTPFCRTLFEAGVAHALRGFGAAQRKEMDAGLVAMAERGETIDRRTYMEAVDSGMALGRQMRLFHESHDLLVTPTVAVEPFEAGRLSPPGYDQQDWLSWAPFAYPFNVTGQPAVTVPCGLTPSGLPVGLQIIGNAFADQLVLSIAGAYERIRGPIGLPADREHPAKALRVL